MNSVVRNSGRHIIFDRAQARSAKAQAEKRRLVRCPAVRAIASLLIGTGAVLLWPAAIGGSDLEMGGRPAIAAEPQDFSPDPSGLEATTELLDRAIDPAIEPNLSQKEPAADRYRDPEGRFSAPIPTGWSAQTEAGYGILSSPQGGIQIYLLTIPAAQVEGEGEAAIAQAWQIAAPGFNAPIANTLTPPASEGLDSITLINYEAEDATEPFYQAVARLYDGVYYLLLVDASLSAVQQRAAQINIIDSGFEIVALEQPDLRGREPLPVAEVVPALESFIRAGLERFGIPGAAVALVQGGEVVYSQGFGVAIAGRDIPLTPQTHMMIGSTGKSLTTLLMATLVDEGAMDWETPVQAVLPTFAVADPELSQLLTLRNLVCACTGVPRRDFELIFNANELSAEDIVRSLSTFEFFTEFGEAFQYSNQLVATGGYAAAAADGAVFGDLFAGYQRALRDHVTGPMGMDNTTVSFEVVGDRNRYALPHGLSLDGSYQPLPLAHEAVLLPVAPAGSHWSTLEDMTRYLQTLLAVGVAPSGERIVSEANLQQIWTPQVPVGADTAYGLGWFVDNYRGLPLIQHGGNTLGFTSAFGFLPEADLGWVILTNAQGSTPFNEAVAGRMLELAFEQEPEVEAALAFVDEQLQEQFAERENLRDAVDFTTVAPYLGTYRNEALGQLELRRSGEALILDIGEFALPLLPLEDEDDPETLLGYAATEPPLTGLLFELSETSAGERVVQFGSGAIAYSFTLLDPAPAAQSDLENPAPASPDSVNPDSVNPDSVNPDSVNPDAVNPKPATPAPASPDPIRGLW